NAHSPRRGRPDRERRPAHTIHHAGVRAKHLPETPMRAFVEEMEIDVANNGALLGARVRPRVRSVDRTRVCSRLESLFTHVGSPPIAGLCHTSGARPRMAKAGRSHSSPP